MTLLPPLDNDNDRYILMKAKYFGHCVECRADIFEGEDMYWDTKENKAYCYDCGADL